MPQECCSSMRHCSCEDDLWFWCPHNHFVCARTLTNVHIHLYFIASSFPLVFVENLVLWFGKRCLVRSRCLLILLYFSNLFGMIFSWETFRQVSFGSMNFFLIFILSFWTDGIYRIIGLKKKKSLIWSICQNLVWFRCIRF